MANDLSIQVATSMMHMMADRTSTEIGITVMKMQAQQDMSIATMIANLAAAGKNAGYTASGASVTAVTQGSLDSMV
jgi:hypothetical protein